MNKETNSNRKGFYRRHSAWLASLCVAAIAVVACVGLLSVPSSMEPGATSDVASSGSAAVSDGSVTVDGGQTQVVNVGTDPAYGDFEQGKVLVLVNGAEDVSNVNAALAGLDLATTKDVSDQDASIGFVEVDVDPAVSISSALGAFEDAGLRVQPNYIYYPAEGTQLDAAEAVEIDDEYAREEWYLESMNLYKAWGIQKAESGSNGRAVSVMVIDTGCRTTHEDLKDNIVATYNSVSNLEGDADNNMADSNGHGTHVAGIVSARANNQVGIAGTSYNAGLVIAKSDKGTNSDGTPMFMTTDIAPAYQWLLSDSGDGTTVAQKHNVRVVNMSLGGNAALDMNDALYGMITQAKEAGILTVCAAGNGGKNGPYDVVPGDYSDCFTVINLQQASEGDNGASKDASGKYYVMRSNSSNYNVASGDHAHSKSISAPGTYIYSTVSSADRDYGSKDGTSMASPAVAGIAALAFAYNPDLTPDQVRALIEQTAADVNTPGWDAQTGYGEADAYHALQVLSARIDMEGVPYKGTADLKLTCADDSAPSASEWTWGPEDSGIVTVDGESGTVRANELGSVELVATHPSGVSVSKTVSVVPGDIANAQVETISSQTYTGQAIEPAVSVSMGAEPLAEDTDYTVSYENNVNAGSATVVVTGDGTHFSGELRANFTIVPASMSAVTVDDIPTQGLSNGAATPNPVVKFGSTVLTKGVDYTVSYENNMAQGTGRAIITGMGNYAGSISKDFAIAMSVSGATLQPVEAVTYNGQAQTPKPAVTLEGAPLVEGRDFTYEYKDNLNAGTAYVRVVGAGDYGGATDFEQCPFTIDPCSLSAATASIPTQTYTGKALTPDAHVSVGSTVLVKDVDYDVFYSNNINAGNATVTIVGKGNYAGTRTMYFSIAGGALDPLMITVSNTPVYSGSELRPVIKVRDNAGKILKEHVDYVIMGYENNVNAGDNVGVVKVTGKGSYYGDVKATFTIRQAPIDRASIGVSAQKFTGSNLTPEPAVALSGYGTLVKNRDYTVSYSNNKNVGTATVTITGKGNYTGTAEALFSITGSSSSSQSSNSSSSSNSNSGSNSSSSSNSGSSSSSSSSTVSQRDMYSGAWANSNGRWWYMYDSTGIKNQKKAYPTNEWISIEGGRYHFDKSGWMQTGWLLADNRWYWLGSDGAMKTGWQNIGGSWYYFATDGIMRAGRQTVDGQTYYLRTSGAMHTGWNLENGTWYYYDGSGAMAKGWRHLGGAWYYMGSDGKMLTGKQTVDGQTYYLRTSGAMHTGWNLENGTWYYYDGSGAMAKGWRNVSGAWYFLDKSTGAMKQYWLDDGGQTYFLRESGAMLTGWASIDGTWYYFNGSGAMVKNSWIGNYYVGSNGAMATNTWIDKYHVNADGLWDATR